MDNTEINQKIITNYDAVKDAYKQIKPFEEEQQTKRKSILDNATVLITFISLGLLFLLFMYNSGIAEVYNIPVDCLSLDLKQYFSFVSMIIPWAVSIFWYFSLFKSDKIQEINRISVKRMFLGFIVLCGFIYKSNLYNWLGYVLSLIIPIGVCLVVELLNKAFFKPIGRPLDSEIKKEEEYKKRVKSYVESFVLSSYYKKWVAVFLCCAVMSPIVGIVSAKARMEYQVFNINSIDYVVISDDSDRVIAQKAEIDDNALLIKTDSYYYFLKEDLELFNCKYKNVFIGK